MLDYQFDFSRSSELKRAPPSGIDIVVAGGGPGGLFAALHCYRKGHNVKVLESGGGYDLNGQFETNSFAAESKFIPLRWLCPSWWLDY